MAFSLLIAIAACSFQHFVWGALYYGVLPSSQIFVRLAYPNLAKKDMAKMDPPVAGYTASMLGGIGATLILHTIMRITALATSVEAAIAFGATMGLYGLMDSLPHNFFEQRPFGLTILHGVYHVLGGAMKGFILYQLL